MYSWFIVDLQLIYLIIQHGDFHYVSLPEGTRWALQIHGEYWVNIGESWNFDPKISESSWNREFHEVSLSLFGVWGVSWCYVHLFTDFNWNEIDMRV